MILIFKDDQRKKNDIGLYQNRNPQIYDLKWLFMNHLT